MFPIHTVALALFLTFFVNQRGFQQGLLFCFGVLFALQVIYLLVGLRSMDPTLIFDRLEGAFLVTYIVAALVAVFAAKYGENNFQKAILKTMIFFLPSQYFSKVERGFSTEVNASLLMVQ
jgi:hypothetical protein